MSSRAEQPAGIGVRGYALRQQATPDLAIALLRPTVPEHELHRHQHAEMHLVLLLAGRYVSSADGMPDVCAEPALVLNPPGTDHRDRFRSQDGLFVTLAMPAAAFDGLFGGLARNDRPRRLPPPAVSAGMKLLSELACWEGSSPLAVESAIFQMLASPVSTTEPSRPGAALSRVMDRLDDVTSPLPSVADLACLADVHPVYLARVFRKHYGISPSDYIRRRRLHQAVSQIVAGRTIAGIAPRLGFTDDSHLHHSFVRQYGITPGAFRRLALGRSEVSRIQDARLLER